MYSSNIFGELYDKCLVYLSKQIDFISHIIEADFLKENTFSIYMKNLMDGLIGDLECVFSNELDMNIIYDFHNRIDYELEYNSMFVLAKFSNIEDNIVLIGGN